MPFLNPVWLYGMSNTPTTYQLEQMHCTYVSNIHIILGYGFWFLDVQRQSDDRVVCLTNSFLETRLTTEMKL